MRMIPRGNEKGPSLDMVEGEEDTLRFLVHARVGVSEMGVSQMCLSESVWGGSDTNRERKLLGAYGSISNLHIGAR